MPKIENSMTRDLVKEFFDHRNKEGIKKNILYNLMSHQGRDPERALTKDIYTALAYTMRDFLIDKWINTQRSYYTSKTKRVYYLSLEFLIGRSLDNSLINLGCRDLVAEILQEMGYSLEDIIDQEEDAALGNGGLGRLAACFMDSIATMDIPAYGYGINYEYGLFNQRIIDGYQVESPDNWLRFGTPWEFERPIPMYPIKFHGKVNSTLDEDGNLTYEWVDAQTVMAIACDILVPGYNNDNVINMRLWKARASRELDLTYFDRGDYIGAVHTKVESETISKVLYPPDKSAAGHELRLKQQYFFVAATFLDILRRFAKYNDDYSCFSDKVAIQLNDTHPAIAIPELMRVMMDECGLGWEQSWDICVKTFSYTNHTLMPEALEKWPVDLIGRLLPRHLQIIHEINQRFLDQVREAYPGDEKKIREMSIIEEGPTKKVRMANLAIIGSHSVNGVAALHTHLLRTKIFKNFNEFFPGRFKNITNGITPRRWLYQCNRPLSNLICEAIGDKWIIDLGELQRLRDFAESSSFQEAFQKAKRENKIRLAGLISRKCNITVNPDSIYDVQVKRIHEYKRQLLNILHVVSLYRKIITSPDVVVQPRTVIFGGKAAPGYLKAKLIIKLINSVANTINNDPRASEFLKVVFLPNYGVSQAEKIIPAADLSEQISTAGTEASGTGNMKFALNGALTIGTLDGANIEIREEVGEENIFIFGLNAKEAEWEKRSPSRTPYEIYERKEVIRDVIDTFKQGCFSNGDKGLFKPIIDDLLNHNRDPYLHLIDMEDYLRCQEKVAHTYLSKKDWNRKAIMNVASMGKFSSDRCINEYARNIWGISNNKTKP